MTATPGKLRVAFAGTPEFSARHLQHLVRSGFPVVAAYTQPDRPARRGNKALASPVKQLAESMGIPVCQPATLRSEQAQLELAAWRADVMVVVAYGLILPPPVLATPRLGCINVHASLLPRWRGAAPVERAIEADDRETGVTIMQMDAGLDTGDMLLQAACPIDMTDTGDSLREKLAVLGCKALVTSLQALAAGEAMPRHQDDSQSTYANKLSKAEALVEWTQSAALLARRIRAFCSSNIMFTVLAGQRIRLWQARPMPADTSASLPGTILWADKSAIGVACGTGTLALERLQLPGGKVLPVEAILNGHHDLFRPGARFEPAP